MMELYCRTKNQDVKVDIYTETCLEPKDQKCEGCSRNRNLPSSGKQDIDKDLDWAFYTIEEELLWFTAHVEFRNEEFKLKDEMNSFYKQGIWGNLQTETQAKRVGVV